jgi:hypothetical protein
MNMDPESHICTVHERDHGLFKGPCVISCDLSYAHSESDDAMYALGFFDVRVEPLRCGT